MSNSVYERLKALIQDMGFIFTEGGITKAEIMAYTAGIVLVNDMLEKTMKSLILKPQSKEDLAYYCRMLSINDENYTLQELENCIRMRLSERFSFATAEELNKAFAEIGSGSYEIVDGGIRFSDIGIGGVKKVGEFIRAYVPFCAAVFYEGTGMTFDEWDAIAKCWDEYDRMYLPFNIIDKLGGDCF